MGAYNPHPNLYNPQVGPNTQGYGPALASAFSQVSGAAIGAIKDDRNNQQQTARDERLFQQQMQRDDKNWGQQMQYADKMKTEKEQQEKDTADGLLGGMIAMYPDKWTPAMAQAADKMNPKAKIELAQALAQTGAEEHRTTAQLNAAAQKREQDYQFQQEHPPQPWSVQAGDATIYGVGNNPMGSTKPTKSSSLQQNQGQNGETIWTYGDKVIDPSNIMIQKPGPYGKGEGLVPLQPKQTAPVRGVPVKQPDGTVIFMDPTTGRPLPGQGGPAGAAPSKTQADYYN